jgi:hypothetical protein
MSTIMLNPIQPQAQTATGIYSPGMTSTRQWSWSLTSISYWV